MADLATDIASRINVIDSELGWMSNVIRSKARRLECASQAGADLAAAVYQYIEDPEGVGTDALKTAYGDFMALHAGNFYKEPLPA